MEFEILSTNNSNNNKNGFNGNLMPASTSQIFAQAAAFHISQNVCLNFTKKSVFYLLIKNFFFLLNNLKGYSCLFTRNNSLFS
jgi:hypothetical protein